MYMGSSSSHLLVRCDANASAARVWPVCRVFGPVAAAAQRRRGLVAADLLLQHHYSCTSDGEEREREVGYRPVSAQPSSPKVDIAQARLL